MHFLEEIFARSWENEQKKEQRKNRIKQEERKRDGNKHKSEKEARERESK